MLDLSLMIIMHLMPRVSEIFSITEKGETLGFYGLLFLTLSLTCLSSDAVNDLGYTESLDKAG